LDGGLIFIFPEGSLTKMSGRKGIARYRPPDLRFAAGIRSDNE
jgi:hypothetical protein